MSLLMSLLMTTFNLTVTVWFSSLALSGFISSVSCLFPGFFNKNFLVRIKTINNNNMEKEAKHG